MNETQPLNVFETGQKEIMVRSAESLSGLEKESKYKEYQISCYAVSEFRVYLVDIFKLNGYFSGRRVLVRSSGRILVE
jgi:hypothetical protein